MSDVKLPFLAAGRIKGGGFEDTCLARYHSPHSEPARKQATEEIFRKLMRTTGARRDFVPGMKIRLQWQEGAVCCFRDASGSLLFCLVTAQSSFPERIAWDLLSEFAGSVAKCPNHATCGENELQEELSSVMSELIEKYSQAKDSTASIEISSMGGRASKFHQNQTQTCCQRCTSSCAVM